MFHFMLFLEVLCVCFGLVFFIVKKIQIKEELSVQTCLLLLFHDFSAYQKNCDKSPNKNGR